MQPTNRQECTKPRVDWLWVIAGCVQGRSERTFSSGNAHHHGRQSFYRLPLPVVFLQIHDASKVVLANIVSRTILTIYDKGAYMPLSWGAHVVICHSAEELSCCLVRWGSSSNTNTSTTSITTSGTTTTNKLVVGSSSSQYYLLLLVFSLRANTRNTS